MINYTSNLRFCQYFPPILLQTPMLFAGNGTDAPLCTVTKLPAEAGSPYKDYILVLFVLDSCLSCRKTCDRHAER